MDTATAGGAAAWAQKDLSLGVDGELHESPPSTPVAHPDEMAETTCTKTLEHRNQIWDPFGRAVCINLVEREDRFEMAKSEFDQVGLAVDFHRVTKSPKGGIWGCYESHRDIIRRAFDDGLEHVLIFEDDVLFQAGWEDHIRRAADILAVARPAFDAIYLGHQTLYVVGKIKDTFNIKCANTHAYVVSRRGMAAFLRAGATIEAALASAPHDHILNSVWTYIIVPALQSPIVQNEEAGSDNAWLEEIPAEYREWFQIKVIAKYEAFQTKLLACTWWFPACIRPASLIIAWPIDDGKVKVSAGKIKDAVLALIMLALCFIVSLMYPPQQGRCHLMRAMVGSAREFVFG